MDEASPVHRGADHRGFARAGSWDEGDGAVPQARYIAADILRLEGEVWWHERVGRQATEAAGRRERQAEEAAGGGHVGQRGSEGHHVPKVVTPAARRSAVSAAREVH